MEITTTITIIIMITTTIAVVGVFALSFLYLLITFYSWILDNQMLFIWSIFLYIKFCILKEKETYYHFIRNELLFLIIF